MVKLSGLPDRSFKRRFRLATGTTPIEYVQHLRVQEAKRRLERTEMSVDDISWAVGYEEPAFFRRLFKRITRLTPSEYRRKFSLPDFSALGEGRGNDVERESGAGLASGFRRVA
jgi:transcriptional regulator GlxA family with amidase domain